MPHIARRSVITLSSLVSLLVAVGGCSQDIINHSDSTRKEGIEQFEQRRYADAAGTFRNAARQDPRDYRSLYYLGASSEKLNLNQQAIEAYKASLDAQPHTLAGKEDETGRLRTLDALANLIARTDSRDAELNQIEQRVKKDQSPADLFVLAKIYRYRGDADNAVDCYNRAILKTPSDFILNKEFGLYLEQLGQSQRAETLLRKAYATRTNDEQVAAALRRLGVVPGPALKDEKALVAPPIPKGPIPPVTEWKIPGLTPNNNSQDINPQPAASPQPPAETVQVPKD
jgi:tetratricopeptide (TPR) repeat protein